MAFVFRNQLDDSAAALAVDFYGSLSEKDRRRYAAVEARRLGRGGASYLSELLGCSKRTIQRGIAELSQLTSDPAQGRIRRPGAGRKKSLKPNSASKTT